MSECGREEWKAKNNFGGVTELTAMTMEQLNVAARDHHCTCNQVMQNTRGRPQPDGNSMLVNLDIVNRLFR